MFIFSTRETIITALVEKCLGATKAGTKQKATDIILLYAEIDTPEPVLVRTLLIFQSFGRKKKTKKQYCLFVGIRYTRNKC